MSEPLTKLEFEKWKGNEFSHLRTDVNWLKWLNGGVALAVAVRLVLLFFGI